MKKISFAKDILPHLVAVIIFLIITISFFNPVFFDDQKLAQSDIVQWEASAHELMEYRSETGEEGLWTNSIFGGMPAYLISVKWGNELIKHTHAVFALGLPHPVRIIFVSMLSFYIMLLCFKVNPYLALIGSVAFGLSSYNIIGLTAGHNARISAVSFMPLVMGGVHLAMTRNKWLGASLTALALAMQLRVNHLQITYYLAFIIGIYVLLQLIYAYKEGEIKEYGQRLGLLTIAAILAIGTFFGEFYATYEYGKYSNRGASELTQQVDDEMNADGLSPSYAFQYSNGTWDPFTLFIPNALGGNGPFDRDSDLANYLRRNGANTAQMQQYLQGIPTYWGSESPTTYYAGAIMVFLFILGCLLVERKYVIWLVAVAVLGIILSYGRNMSWFNDLMFNYFPGYNKFRSVTFTMVMPIFAISLLGMLGLQRLLDMKWDKVSKKKFLIAFNSTAGLALLLAAIAGIFSFRSSIDSQLPQELASIVKGDRKALFVSDTLRAFFFIALFALVIFLNKIGQVKPLVLKLCLISIGIAEIVMVSNRFISDRNYSTTYRNNAFALSPADRSIKQNQSLGDRVIDVNSQFYNAVSSYHHHLVNGYHGARIRRYQELMDKSIIQEFSNVAGDLNNGSIPDFSSTPVLNMMNTRFIIERGAQSAMENPRALGAAWFVSDLKYVEDADGEFNNTLSLRTPGTTAIVNKNEVPEGITTSVDGDINLVDYHPGYWKYESSNSSSGFAVFSEVHYPKGFKVKIDGNEVEMLRANYVLRALQIPAGDHTIEFSFEPKIYTVGSLIMTVFSVIVLILFFGSVYLSIRTYIQE
ncbi:YfhO family protein [Roseivirga sp.]|uniref:YfhO family protein n=1 Tax=Roseivirga sp. TaxID=1964215 RepID=UPI003B51A289